MDIKIFYILMIIGIIFSGTAFGNELLISVQTDNSDYDEGDTIIISGKIFTIIGNTEVTLQLFYNDTLLDIAQIQVSDDGNYSHIIIAEGRQWQNDGIHTVKATYGEGHVAKTEFTFLPKSKIIETIDNFEVNMDDNGTFDLSYAIKGGTIENITIEPQILGILIKIDSINDGTLVLDLPRKYIDAEKQNGKDEVFIILIDDLQTTYDESKLYSDFRTITINFEEGDSEIQIIGTHVVPEFGTIVMIILTIGIMASILLTKNKFQIKF